MQADKLSSIGLLAAGVAHEVNTPLAVISTYAQMLAKQISGDEQKSKLLDKIAKQTFRASEIVNSLLNFSRTSTTAFVEVDLNKVIRDTLTLIEHQLEKSGIEVKLDLAAGFAGRKGEFGQAAAGVSESVPERARCHGIRRHIAVRTWNEDGFARVEVADSGQGISPEHLEAHLRSVLHHQRAPQRNRPGPGGDLRHRARARRRRFARKAAPEPAPGSM